MTDFGYAGRVLKADLSSGNVSEIPTADYADRLIGGRGIGARIYWDEVPPEAGALDPANVLIFNSGPFAGFPGLAASRWHICGKSPVNHPNTFSYANCGGSWGVYLKFAGYDGLILQGQAERPVYLLIRDGHAEIRDATDLWGQNAVATREILKGRHGKETRVATIGPAGENQVGMAVILADDDAAGSAGFGAVMGAKKIKAVCVQGGKKPVVAHPQRLADLRKRIRELRPEPTTIWTGGYHDTFMETSPKFKKTLCWSCPSGCVRAIYEADDGKKGKFMCQAISAYLGAARRFYGKDTDVPFYVARLCDEYGVEITGLLGMNMWLWRCLRAGILTEEDTGIPISRLGSLEYMEILLRKISYREGFGEVLGQGVVRAAEIVGKNSVEHLKGELTRWGNYYSYTPRLYMTTSLLYATEPKTPVPQLHHVSFLIHEWQDWLNKIEGASLSTDLVRTIARKYYGGEVAFDFSTYEGKARAAHIIQNYEHAKDCLVLCDFFWPIRYVRHTADHLGDSTLESKVLSAIIGKDIDEEGLSRIGERVLNLQRAILTREGHRGRADDALPETDYTIPLRFELGNPKGLLPGKEGEVISRLGSVFDREKFEQMKDEYYELRGWDVKTGRQTRATLERLQLKDIANGLAGKGLLA
ncbi:MAG: hypothetical protein HY670_03745 [Chloroflexi bacterium]|nr:hypothetical protein [Chloroflexota bacterium]